MPLHCPPAPQGSTATESDLLCFASRDTQDPLHSLSPAPTCIPCSVTQYCPTTRGVSASQHVLNTPPFTWTRSTLLQTLSVRPSRSMSFMNPFDLLTSAWLFRFMSAPRTRPLESSSCSTHVQLVSRLYFDLRVKGMSSSSGFFAETVE